jgi:hypothetical protein
MLKEGEGQEIERNYSYDVNPIDNNIIGSIPTSNSGSKKEQQPMQRKTTHTNWLLKIRGRNNKGEKSKSILRKDHNIVLDLLILVFTSVFIGSITFLMIRSVTTMNGKADDNSSIGDGVGDRKAHNGFVDSKAHSNLVIIDGAETTTETPTTTKDNNDDKVIWDVQSFVNDKLKSGEKYIKLPTGRHYVQPNNNHEWGVHLRLFNLVDVTIDGRGTELICTRTTRAITISNCNNTKLIGLKIDYDPLPYTQGVITDMSDDKSILYVEILNGYPYPDSSNSNSNSSSSSSSISSDDGGTWDTNKIEIYSPSLNDELVTRTYYGVTFEEEEKEEGHDASSSSTTTVVTVRKKPFDNAGYTFENIGDIAVIGFRNIEKMIPHAVLVDDSIDTVIDDVTVYSSNKFAFFEKNSQNSKYTNNVVDRRPIDEDYTNTARSYRRLRSSNADAFHSKHAFKKGPSFVNCTARYNGDDGIVINGHYHIVTRIVETTPDDSGGTGGGTTKIRIIPKMGLEPNLIVGDRVELVRYDGRRADTDGDDITIVDIVLDDDPENMFLHQYEKDFLNHQILDGIVGSMTRSAPRAYHVTLNRLIAQEDLPLGSLIASSDRQGNHFEIRSCIIGPTRSRGIVAKGSHGIITSNTIQDTWGQGIMLAPMYNWLESGSGNHLSVTKNHISRSHDVAIAVYAFNGLNNSVAPAGAHNNVTIRLNRITESSMPAIAVTSTKKLNIQSNEILGFNNGYLLPKHFNEFGRDEGDPLRQIYLNNVEME